VSSIQFSIRFLVGLALLAACIAVNGWWLTVVVVLIAIVVSWVVAR